MSIQTGTHDISSLLAARNQSVAAFGVDNVARVVANDLAAYSTIARDQLTLLADVTTDRQRIYGGSATGRMMEVDEYGRGPTQRPFVNSQVGFPLRKFQYPWGWTREWEEEKTVGDAVQATQQAQQGYFQRLSVELQRAMYLSANYTHTDHLVDNVAFGVKRYVNADSAAIPNGPNGETFTASSHTHYLATATLTTTGADAAITTLVEHGHGSDVRFFINQANETAWRALTGFVPLQVPYVNINTAANQPNQRLDITRLNNRLIGYYGAAQVWTKPWAIANYALLADVGDARKPLVVRERVPGSMALRMSAEIDTHPMRSQYLEAKFGIGVWTRTNGVVWQFNSASFSDPTIALP